MLENLPAMIGLATSSLGLAKGAVEIGQGLKGLVSKPDVDTSATKKLLSDLLDRLIRLQTEQLTMQEELLKLQQDQKKRGRSQGQADRYAMVKTELGSLIYSLKPDQARGEPAHDLCASCFEDEVKSVLQPIAHNTLLCGQCGGKFYKPDGQGSGIMIAAVRSKFDGFI